MTIQVAKKTGKNTYDTTQIHSRECDHKTEWIDNNGRQSVTAECSDGLYKPVGENSDGQIWVKM